MTIVINPGYALQFNGVSDSVLVPVNSNQVHGSQTETRKRLPNAISAFTLETWTIPDCGGVIFEQENVMRLSVGSPSSPAPASFEVRLRNLSSGRDSTFVISTGTPVSNANGRVAYYDGALFPSAITDAHGSYLATSSEDNDTSAFNDGHRELLNVTVTFNRRVLSLHINGDLAASKQFDEDYELVNQQNHIYLGGRGGDFRGVIEAIHWSKGEKPSGRQPYAPLKDSSTLGLWRFEEPIEPVNILTTTPSLTASAAASSTFSIGVTAAQTLVDELSGQSGLTSINFVTQSPWNNAGEYNVTVYSASASATVNIPKVPYNILINPLGYSPTTGKPTGKAPERLRLMAIDANAGTVTVESIHLDFSANPVTGRRGLLMNHDAGRFVIITGDCIVDGGNGNDYQPHGSGTQFSQRQGQVVIDESEYSNHGLMFSLSMAIDTHDYNTFSATTNMGREFVIGHSGRHILNHIVSHPFMGMLPPPISHEVEKKLDGASDSISAVFPSQFADVKTMVPVNSIVSSYDTHGPITPKSVSTYSLVTEIVENGMSDIDDTQRDVLALGGLAFKSDLFLLKSLSGTDSTDDIRAIIPSIESRIAILEVPQLAAFGYAPFVQMHYNAVDRGGDLYNTIATSRITASAATVITLQSVKSFGADGAAINADELQIGTIKASIISGNKVTIDYAAKTLTFDTAVDAAFLVAATVNAIVQLKSTSPKVMITKTLPNVSEMVTGSLSILDIIRQDANMGALKLFAAGGTVTFKLPDMFPFKDGELEGDSSEGILAENQLDNSLCPSNYLPLVGTDKAQTTPQAIAVAQTGLSSRASVFNKILVRPASGNSDNLTEVADVTAQVITGKRNRIGIYVNNASGYAATTATAIVVDGVDATTIYQIGDRVYKANGKHLGTLTAVSATSITIGAGITEALVDNDEMFAEPVRPSYGTSNQSSLVYEIFDIIEHTSIGNEVKLVIQPSDRRRFNQLTKMRVGQIGDNEFSIEYIMSKGRVMSFDDDGRGNSAMLAHGLLSDIGSSSVYVKGSGAPDSHIVKEIMPGAPVVTMTLGGPGQGAMNTKETWDPSPISRLGWNTRRDCTTKIAETNGPAGTITVLPLNNRATDLQSWGTYSFPNVGTVHLELSKDNITDRNRYASATYTSKTGTTFSFSVAAGKIGTGEFILPDGSEADSFVDWLNGSGIAIGDSLHLDNKFSEESICNDATSINDRLFQTLDTVQHDYQLGTQYASTRALVEIPLFEEFFFDKPELGIFPGPDNSMKIHIDCTHTAHSWSPNPVGRRFDALSPQDPEIFGAFSYTIGANAHRSGTKVIRPYDAGNHRVYIEDANVFPKPTLAPTNVAGLDGSLRYRRAFLSSGEWCIYQTRDTTNHYLALVGAAGATWSMSKHFLRDLKIGALLTPSPGYQDMSYNGIADNPQLISAGYEGRRSFYHDRSNVMTQGGNIDYGLKQYVSAIEFRAGPRTNPHLARIQNKRATSKITAITGAAPVTGIVLEDASLFPITSPHVSYLYRVGWTNAAGTTYYAHYNNRIGNVINFTAPHDANFNPAVGDEISVVDLHAHPVIVYPEVKEDVFLNMAWAYPYAPGGLRNGDTVWMNMHYTNPHAIEGLFCKSRGVLNEGLVWTGFNGGKGALNSNPRDSIPLENFLIGNTCIETAQNMVQHINKTIELNYEALGLAANTAPMVAYLDPYQSTEEYTRILLYDVGHDREFIAFQDLWMQVQTSPDATRIGSSSNTATGLISNADANSGSSIDVAAGFFSQNKELISTEDSDFIESSYAHGSSWNANVAGGLSTHSPNVGNMDKTSAIPRTEDAVTDGSVALAKHQEVDASSREYSTFFDTPDGTRCIPAFLAMKGIRNTTLDLADHDESRLSQLDHWSKMDFIRRLTVDLGEVALRDGVTDIEAAAREVIRLINQGGALNGRTHARRPADQFLGESERFDLSSPGPTSGGDNGKDPSASHLHADFAATGSTHDPAPFWDIKKGFASHDRGTHMGYVRAHLGRVVLDSNGNKGFSIVIHSTVPGAGGRNFCTWLDNSRAQTPYRPQYLIGHGGRFRNYWCQPDEITGENMHPAPMPINRFGRPFAPITTLKEFLPPEEINDAFRNNLNLGPEMPGSATIMADNNVENVSGRNANTVINESFETKSPAATLIDGLRIGTVAKARINFGGFTQAGIPGWAPDAGKWGFGRDNEDSRYNAIYGNPNNVSSAMLSLSIVESTTDGYIPKVDVENQSIGNGNLYGIKFVDHRGGIHTVRMVYRQFGEKFANDMTTLPPTIDEEVIIYFDDRDVAQGGFTIGKHMVGEGEVCGEKTGGTLFDYKGNLWNTYPSPAIGIRGTTIETGSGSARKLAIVLDAPYDVGGTNTHPDILGYMGFPESGLFQLSTQGGDQGITFHYNSRTHNNKTGVHEFHGLTGGNAAHADGSYLISPRINFTSVLTDEVIAAAVEFAINGDGKFDCRDMLAPDGRTLGEWGVGPSAITVSTKSDSKVPLSTLFEVSREKDWGLLEGASSDAVVGVTHTGGLSNGERDKGTRLDIGYVPRTVLHVSTKYRGTNANTATPILVDTQNNIVDITTWQRNLRGENYTNVAGDHIIPNVSSPMIEPDTVTPTQLTLPVGEYLYLIAVPASNHAESWGERFTIWWGGEEYATVRSDSTAAGATERTLVYSLNEGTSTGFASVLAGHTLVKNGGRNDAINIDGVRRAGSKKSSPFLYFRGARDSPDHWVPLYFGGGFSGTVLDINDGTQNDYGDFYTHPYSVGPTGSAGFQNIGEVAGAYALIDTNAMLAMFPGVPYLDQHKGQNNPPLFNQDGLLPFDMTKGANTKATGITYTDGANSVNVNIPSPVIIRFAHPHARYSAEGATTDQTTYMIFGPGQAFPHNTAAFEPQGANIVSAGNGYSSVPIYIGGDIAKDSFLPNQLTNGDALHHSGFNRLNSISAHLPMTDYFQKNNLTGFNYEMNWQPTKGFPNVNAAVGKAYSQVFSKAFYYEGTDHAVAMTMPKHAHPFAYIFADVNGAAVGSGTHPKTRKSTAIWHMDGGYHPGGHFLDNHVNINPKNPITNSRLSTGSGNQQNVTAFRPCGLLSKAYLAFYGGTPTNQDADENVVVVDATRCQNAEELAAVISASINTFPGKDPLKAIGGTFLPSMQNAHKQDRYAWAEHDLVSATVHNPVGPVAATLTVAASIANLPKYGWLRVSDGIGISGYAPYIDHNGVNTFTLAVNPISGTSNVVDPSIRADIPLTPVPPPNTKVYVWTKAGAHRHNNVALGTTRDHMTQVHFSGLIDAVDRTKPIGAVGWNGEAYSYLNSYNGLSMGSNLYAAGKGAWHPFLGFNPYGAVETCLSQGSPVGVQDTTSDMASNYCVTGLTSRHLIAVTHESELPLIAKTDRDGILSAGDWLMTKQTNSLLNAGTVKWDADKVHNKSRYVGPATAGPHIEAQMHSLFNRPTVPANYPATGAIPTDGQLHRTIQSGDMAQATPCLYPTGDLFWDESVVKSSNFHEDFDDTYGVECIGTSEHTDYLDTDDGDSTQPNPGLYGFYARRSAARNFSAEHLIWKRMDGGSLTMPAVNARGLGMIPWVKKGGSLVGEKVLGNVRFSFETTNMAMFPIIQAQELAHPSLAEQHPLEIRNALMIPNEDIQFNSVQVIDDTGQEHRIEGGSPLGTVILDFRHVSDRAISGLAPSLAGSGISPNMKIRLPNADEIPGNIIIRPGFDRIQAYQNETIGSGGLQHPAQPVDMVSDMFNNTNPGPRLFPTWEDNGWEHLSQDGTDISTTTSKSRLKFPASSNEGWSDYTDNAPLQTSYEPHDRSLFFHVTRMGITMTHRYDSDELDFTSQAGTTLTAGSAPSPTVWQDSTEQSGGRWFLRVYDPTTDKGVLASYTGVAGNSFTGVVLSPDFTSFVTGKTGLKIVPSYYMPAGSTRFFAARRLRDHSEYSGASPDMKKIDWFDTYSNLPANTGAMVNPSAPYSRIIKPKMTPMPIPRMGHHYVSPTMALLPGHYAHPAYQRVYDLHQSCRSSNFGPITNDLVGTKEGVRTSATATVITHEPSVSPNIWFSGPSAPYGPSDIHGGAFTLLTETKVKYEGYGILAALGVAGTTNSQGGHSVILEAGGTYTLNNHFPDPLEVGAYQVIIQPNVFAQQLKGFHLNHSDEIKAPSEAGVKVTELTGQQVNTVIAIDKDPATNGAYTLILAEAVMADVRGCEIIINEVILDIEPDAGSQFTNLPPLSLYNPLGVQETTSPSFSRRSLPYRPGMFSSATPGYTLTVPWWGVLHKDGANHANASKWKHLEWHKPDNYYEFCRVSYGCIGAQLTLAGYPTTYLDIYETHKRNRSLNPVCVVISHNGANEITVDNNDLFPVTPYYAELLEFNKDGVRYTATYTNRTGTLAHATLGQSTKFSGVVGSAVFWANIGAGTVLKLSRPYDTYGADSIYTDSKSSITTRIMPQLANGSRDTNSLHLADAFLCMWHPNLGRPFTWYSDDAARGFYDKTGVADASIDQKGYNHLPEHFETIHYHDFNYVASKGPFGLSMKWVVPPGGALPPLNVADGTVHPAGAIDGDPNLSHQGGTDGANKYNFNGFWPGGSHGGGAVSRLEAYGNSIIGWGSQTYGIDCKTYSDSTGITEITSPNDRNYCFGYRMAVRQAYNRPRWSPYTRGWLEVANSNALLGYYHGPLIQQDSKTNGWDYVGADVTLGDVDSEALYVGILERITQVTSLLNQDQIGRQVRYSDGRRHTSAFGCPVRTIRNASTVTRLYPGDDVGKGISELANAHRYYMVDWWGNTRGEDVRRFPVRGFGIRPSWDPEDAYTDTNVTHRPAAHDLFEGDGLDRHSGSDNTDNNNAANMGIADWFNPASALRVGDRGDGRGCRWPTVFNENLLMAVSEAHDATGLVLSHSTAEPSFGQGLVRPSNSTLQAGEIERGISDRLDLNDEGGLLKPSANVGEGIEAVTADIRGADPVTRNDVRIGLDVDTIAELNDGESREYIIMSTEAASLHTDKEVGQRTNIRGAHDVGNRTLKDLDMTALNWGTQPIAGVIRHSNAHANWSLGGTYIINWSTYAGILDDKGWGKAGASSSSNPYQNAGHDPTIQATNDTDSTIEFLYRPIQNLDYKHSQMFRHAPAFDIGPQSGSNFYRATSGGKYGMFLSDAKSARVGTPSLPPYAPVYTIDPTGSLTVPTSQGPKILGVDVTGYDKSDITNPVARVVMSENTLEHFRADASRKSVDDDEGDFTVEPRYSQTLHPKGSDGDATYNTGDHSGE